MADKVDLCIIATDKKVVQRCESICKAFRYEYKHFEHLEEFVSENRDFRLLLLHGSEEIDGEKLDEVIRSVMSFCADAFLLCLLSDKNGKKLTGVAKKAGCNLVLLEDEFYTTSKPEFIFSQVIRATFIPIKATDIVPGVPLGFDLYHLLPQRNKFLKFAFDGDEINETKMAKIIQAAEVYIHKDHAVKFARYVQANSDKSPNSLAKRCRSQFLALSAVYTSLVFLVTDQSELGSFKQGDELLSKCRELTMALLDTLGMHGNAWEIINRSVIGDFGSVERSPAVAAYAALFALFMNVSEIDRLMVAALFSELGLLFLSPKITEHLRNDTLNKLTPDEIQAYRSYPLKSINIVLDRKLQLDEKLRDLVLRAHERADGNGFPGKYHEATMPMEAYLLAFAYEVDRRTAVKLGQAAVDPEKMYRAIIEEEAAHPGRFSKTFLTGLQSSLAEMGGATAKPT